MRLDLIRPPRLGLLDPRVGRSAASCDIRIGPEVHCVPSTSAVLGRSFFLPSMPQNGPLLASPGTHLGPRLGSREEVALPGTRSGQGLWLWEVADKPARTARVPGWLRPADPLAEHLLAPLGALGGVAPACEPPLERKRAVVKGTFASPQSGDARAHRRASQSPACWCYALACTRFG